MIQSALEDRLDDRPAWPSNILKLEMESAGIYQDRTGTILQDLKSDDIVGETSITINGNNIPFVTPHESPPPEPDDEMAEAARAFTEMCEESADFAELCTYAALCKIYNEVGDDITGMRVLPKGERTHILNGVDDGIDAWLEMLDECIPVEVYNGRDYLGVTARNGGHSHKYEQMLIRSSNQHPVSNPMLINRRADDEMQSKVRENLDGMVVNTDIMLACEPTHPHIQDTLELLNLDHIVELLPPLVTEDGAELDGERYDRLTTEDPSVITPPTKMAPAADALPTQYMRRVRGGVQLHYVNSFYRSTDDPVNKEASLLLQAMYNLLLREGGMSRDVALDLGWEEFSANYRQIQKAKAREDIIREKASEYITRLHQERILTRRDNRLHARKSTHPQQTFSF